MNRHKTKRIVISDAHVDLNIAPIVQYINSFDDCITLFSCEGYGTKSKKVFQKPYILFFCHSNLDLQVILNKLSPYAHVTVELHYLSQQLRYHLEFYSKDHLVRANKCIK